MVQANGEDSKPYGRIEGPWDRVSLQLHISQRHLQITQVPLDMYDLQRFSNCFLTITSKQITG